MTFALGCIEFIKLFLRDHQSVDSPDSMRCIVINPEHSLDRRRLIAGEFDSVGVGFEFPRQLLPEDYSGLVVDGGGYMGTSTLIQASSLPGGQG